jgi:hypothetical protein
MEKYAIFGFPSGLAFIISPPLVLTLTVAVSMVLPTSVQGLDGLDAK